MHAWYGFKNALFGSIKTSNVHKIYIHVVTKLLDRSNKRGGSPFCGGLRVPSHGGTRLQYISTNFQKTKVLLPFNYHLNSQLLFLFSNIEKELVHVLWYFSLHPMTAFCNKKWNGQHFIRQFWNFYFTSHDPPRPNYVII